MTISRLFNTLLLILVTSISLSASSPRRPDFAFPVKVSDEARAALDQALAKGDDVGALRAALNLTLAQNAIDSDRMPASLALLDSIENRFATPAPRAVCSLMRATIYCAYFDSQRWTITRRPALPPGEPVPDDYTEWNAPQFEARVAELLNAAMSSPEALLATPLATYDPLLRVSSAEARITYMFYPSLLDFIGGQAIELMSGFGTPGAVALADEYRATLLRLNASSPAPYVVGSIQSILARGGSLDTLRDRLLALYTEMGSSEFAAEPLIALGDMTDADDIPSCRVIKDLIDGYIGRHPSYIRVNCLKNILTQITRPRVCLDYRSSVVPSDMLRVRATGYNGRKVTATLYRLPVSYVDKGDEYFQLKDGRVPDGFTRVGRMEFDFSGVPPFSGELTDSLTVADAGLYILVASGDGLDRDANPRIIRASSLAAGIFNFGARSDLWAVNPLTGRPASGASVMRMERSGTGRPIATTDSLGMAPLSFTEGRSIELRPVAGDDCYAPTIYAGGRTYPRDTTRRYSAELYTDLPLYHPGDSVGFAALVYSLRDRDYRTESALECEATLYDANRQPVGDTLRLVTDRFGRVSGSFLLPSDGRLNGSYSIRLSSQDVTARVSFTVSDYKLPSFEVKVTDAATDTPVKGAVTLSGSAMTYSGMPLQGARVAVKVSRERLWRWWDPSVDFIPIDLDTATGGDGAWQIEISPAALAAAGANAWFRADVTVTSATGESQAASTLFTLGPAIRLEAPLRQAYNVSAPVTLPVRALNTRGESVTDGIEIAYTVARGATTVASGSFTPGKPVDWSAIAPGSYEITFATAADTVRCHEIALYNPAIDRSPSSRLLWTPDGSLTSGVDDVTPILLGTSMDTTYVIYTLSDYERIIDRQMLVLPAGLHTIKVASRHGGSPELKASFVAAGRYQSEILTVAIEPAIDPRGLTLRAESMRDRAVPGAREKWTFSVVNALGVPVEAAVMVDMYNKALDALTLHRWYLSPMAPWSAALSFRRIAAGDNTSIWLSAPGRSLGCPSYSLPAFQLYGMSLSPQTFRNVYIRGTRMMKASAMKDEAMDGEDVLLTVNEHSQALEAAPVANAGGALADYSAETTEEEADMGDGGEAPAPRAPEVAYRDAATPLALFRPMLATQRDGTLGLTFTLPEANATWALQALAWTDDMRVAPVLNATILASKPVMVKPNVPRFLREGDTVEILTSVMNATDSAMTVEVVTEAYNPLTGESAPLTVTTLTLAPNSSAPVSSTLTAAPGTTLTGFRARATAANFTDGEQSPIPVLEAVTPVIDSKPFYMGASPATTTVTLPAPGNAADAVTTLTYCGNPVWYVVTALPGLSADNPSTAPEAARSLFSAAVAWGILDSYPAIASALARWTSTRGAEALEPMLERNPELKTLLLSATPWMTDAQTDRERMERLALLLDPARIQTAISGATAKLAECSRPGGGWAWIARIDEPSQWVTSSILTLMAELKSLGYLPSDSRLSEMIAAAVGYLDAEAAKTARRHPETIQTDYAMLRAAYPDVKADATTERILARATQEMVGGWKSLALALKPSAAIFMSRRGYRNVAAEILASMREYMETTPDKGSFFPSIENGAWGYLSYTARALMAFARIEPGCREIDGLRHWLVVQKQATDWGSSAAATEVVAAILASSPSWIGDAGAVEITVNGRRLTPGATDSSLGAFTESLDVAPGKDVTVRIDKKGDTPAWGALMRRATVPLRDVAAASTPDLSIEKSIIGADSLVAGSKVTVRIVVHVGRNLDYVAITDSRPACLEPVEQLPTLQWSEGVCFYLEPRDSHTSIFVTTMPKGTYVLSYDAYVNNAGTFATGIATAASQYLPEATARSGASVVTVSPVSQ